jgi:hypothetical protein
MCDSIDESYKKGGESLGLMNKQHHRVSSQQEMGREQIKMETRISMLY